MRGEGRREEGKREERGGEGRKREGRGGEKTRGESRGEERGAEREVQRASAETREESTHCWDPASSNLHVLISAPSIFTRHFSRERILPPGRQQTDLTCRGSLGLRWLGSCLGLAERTQVRTRCRCQSRPRDPRSPLPTAPCSDSASSPAPKLKSQRGRH